MPVKSATPASRIHSLILKTLPPGTRADAVIFGQGGTFDSLGLVSFLADLEYRLSDEFGREFVLASERAMSRGHSPFRDVASLTEYIVEILEQ